MAGLFLTVIVVAGLVGALVGWRMSAKGRQVKT
jgi:hypothetical protein